MIGLVRRLYPIDTACNNQGLPYLCVSYAETAGTRIVNQVGNVYKPGAAAHTRHIGGTGFRGGEGGLPLCRCTASLNGGQLTAQYQAGKDSMAICKVPLPPPACTLPRPPCYPT